MENKISKKKTEKLNIETANDIQKKFKYKKRIVFVSIFIIIAIITIIMGLKGA